MAARKNHEIEGLLRESAPRALAAVARRFGDFAEAEDAVQEAMIDAARQWPAQGLPENPTGWLVHAASWPATTASTPPAPTCWRRPATASAAGAEYERAARLNAGG
jgi:sigma-70-like protein